MLHQGATAEQIQNGLGWKNKASVVAEITRVRELGYNYRRDGELYRLVLPEGISEPAVA